MPRYTFAIGGPEGVRHAGMVQGQSFEIVLEALGEKFETAHGDFLELGVVGFPPARYTKMPTDLIGDAAWQLTNRLAA